MSRVWIMATPRSVIALLVVAVIIAAIAGYFAGRATAPVVEKTVIVTSPPKITLKIIAPWSGREAEYFMTVLDEYKKTHPM